MSDPRQLDQISEAIGELKGSVKAIEKYIHEERHGVNNLAQKVDGLGVAISRDIAAVEARIRIDINSLEGRVGQLELDRSERRGAAGVIQTVLNSRALGWLVGLLISAWAVLTGKVHI